MLIFRRILAALIDHVFLSLASIAIVLSLLGLYFWCLCFIQLKIPSLEILQTIHLVGLQALLVVTRILLGFFYEVWSLAFYQTTFGKWIFHLEVVSTLSPSSQSISLGQSLIRWIGLTTSYWTGGTLFCVILFHPDKKGFHDWLAGTRCQLTSKKDFPFTRVP